jgi:hypothetical protein
LPPRAPLLRAFDKTGMRGQTAPVALRAVALARSRWPTRLRRHAAPSGRAPRRAA